VYADADAQAERVLAACLLFVVVHANEQERLEVVRDGEDAGGGSIDHHAQAALARHADLRKAERLSRAVSSERRSDAPSNPRHRMLSVTPRTANSSHAGSSQPRRAAPPSAVAGTMATSVQPAAFARPRR
jgi:hypothetical protein